MSRIDKALRVREGMASVEESAAEAAPHTSPAFPLTEYARERAPAHESNDAVAPALPAYPPASAPGRQGHAPPKDGDLRARLVTGSAAAVTLEQYRRLAATLHDAQVERGLNTVMVTSAVPAEGKTLTVTNVGLTLSESFGRRVLLIDADLRLPSLHTMFGVPNRRGLSEALLEDRDPNIVEVSSRLSVMTAGRPGPTPLAGLTSARMGALLKQCATEYDWVLLDTSPVGVIPDGQVLARLIGAVILVIHAGSTPAEVVERTVADLGSELILGTVLNRVEERRIPEAGYYSAYGAPAVVD
jgi:protein-tyrosine kinase